MSISFSDLMVALKQALKSGQIGQPVSVRFRLVAPSEFIPPAINELMQLISNYLPGFEASQANGGRFRLQSHPSGLQTNVLILSNHGPSVSLTWVPATQQPTSLKLLVIGNHGVIRLEEEVEPNWQIPTGESPEIDWYHRFVSTGEQSQPVPFPGGKSGQAPQNGPN
ncbi:MAG: hypothetical protein KDA65_08590 [Planctomycetaceae bacterium]|nr:hypothetical protein [Planctomycetaceae bacterium]